MDLRDAGPLTLPLPSLRGFLEVSPHGPTALRAYVVAAPAALGLIRMSELSSDGHHGIFSFFSDAAEAYAWVGVQPWSADRTDKGPHGRRIAGADLQREREQLAGSFVDAAQVEVFQHEGSATEQRVMHRE